jgi:hypothetical protein
MIYNGPQPDLTTALSPTIPTYCIGHIWPGTFHLCHASRLSGGSKTYHYRLEAITELLDSWMKILASNVNFSGDCLELNVWHIYLTLCYARTIDFGTTLKTDFS